MIGRTLGHYRVVSALGAGGMGEVYRAHDEKLDRDVALKVLPAGPARHEEARSRFRREAKALSRLSHPHVAMLLDFDSADGRRLPRDGARPRPDTGAGAGSTRTAAGDRTSSASVRSSREG